MTTKTDLLPLPAEDYVDDEGLWERRYGPYRPEQMEDYARACVAHATEPLKAEIEALRGLEEREQRDEALLRQALDALELRCGTHADERKDLIPALRERLGEGGRDDLRQGDQQ